MNSKLFEEKIKPILVYVGTIGAIIMSVAYILVVLVLIFGFKVKSPQQSIIFAVVNGIIGLIIMSFLRVQGIDFAKNLDENKVILDHFNNKRIEKKSYSMVKYWIQTLAKDAIVKGLSIIFTTAGLIYIVIEGSQDYNLILLAIVNLCLFICFGLLAMASSYDFFCEKYIPYLKEQLELKNKETENARNQITELGVEEHPATSSEE